MPKRSKKPVSGKEMVAYMESLKDSEGIQRDNKKPPQELRSQDFAPQITQDNPEVRKETFNSELKSSDHQGRKVDPSLLGGGGKSELTRGQKKIMRGKLAKGYRDKNQAERSKIILGNFLFKEPKHASDHSVTATVSAESLPENNSEEATGEGHINDSTRAKA